MSGDDGGGKPLDGEEKSKKECIWVEKEREISEKMREICERERFKEKRDGPCPSLAEPRVGQG